MVSVQPETRRATMSSGPELRDELGLYDLYYTKIESLDDLKWDAELDCVRGPLETFKHNIDKILFLMNMPIAVFSNAQIFQFAEDAASLAVIKRLGADLELFRNNSDGIGDALKKFHAEEKKSRESDPYKYADKYVNTIIYMIDIEPRDDQGKGFRNGARMAIEAMLESLVVGAWSAFETLSLDLWVKAVNYRPEPLARMKGHEHRIANKAKGNPTEPEERGQDKQFTPKSDGKDGDTLAEDGKAKFRHLRDIRKAYSRAFPAEHCGTKSDKIDAALADCKLWVLSEVRHNLVHRAGQSDALYRKFTDGLDAPQAGPDGRLVLKGGTVSSLLESAVRSGSELTKGLHEWLLATKDEGKK
jgi:hypothetical protein